nr:hypothetical protein [Tanacetum cinerariifolium]
MRSTLKINEILRKKKAEIEAKRITEEEEAANDDEEEEAEVLVGEGLSTGSFAATTICVDSDSMLSQPIRS